MKKTTGLIIWIAVLAALLVTSYTFYEKYKTRSIIEPPSPNLQQDTKADEQQDTAASGSDQNDTAANNQQDLAATENPDKIMAPDFTLKDLSGNDITLSDYEGKIVILNFWAVWCRYCIEEMPDFNTLDKELEETGDAVILAVNVQESKQTVQEYLVENDIGLKVLMDEDGAISSTYGVSGYPTTFIINPDGSLYTYIPGKTDIDMLHKLLDMVRNGKPLR